MVFPVNAFSPGGPIQFIFFIAISQYFFILPLFLFNSLRLSLWLSLPLWPGPVDLVSLTLYVYLPHCLFDHVSLYLSFYFTLCPLFFLPLYHWSEFYQSYYTFLFLYFLPLYFSFSLPLFLTTSLCLYLFVSLHICLLISLFLFSCEYIYLSTSLSPLLWL